MNDRHTADSITSDALDALYARIETLEYVAAGNKRHVQLIVPDLERAEATIERVRALADRWANALAPDRAYARALRAALDEPAVGPAATQATEPTPTPRKDGPRCVCGDPIEWWTGPGESAGWIHSPGSDTPILDAHTPRPPAPTADEDDDPPVQCWHTEADTPCDWNVCNQPERLAVGDHGTDPREQH